jgi:putative phage-type endonuclease
MEQRSAEWYEARKGRVTASLAGAILGLSPYMSRADAMRVMVREALGAEREFKGNIATDYGTRNEPGALIDYRLETQNDVQTVGFVPFEDWLGASPDGLIGDDGGLEIKCPYGLRDAEKPVPFKSLAEQPHYYAQVQVSLFVTGREWWDFFQWAPNGTALERVEPDRAWRDDNIPRLRQFHAEFLHELEHNAEEHLAPKRVEIDTPEAHRMVAEWDEINEQLERAAERKKDLLADMVKMAGERDALFAGRKLTLVSRQGSVSYAKVVKEHLPELDLEPYRGKATNYWQVS